MRGQFELPINKSQTKWVTANPNTFQEVFMKKNRPKSEKLTKEAITAHFHWPMARVAEKFEVSQTYFKTMCRKHGIARWPYRQATFRAPMVDVAIPSCAPETSISSEVSLPAVALPGSAFLVRPTCSTSANDIDNQSVRSSDTAPFSSSTDGGNSPGAPASSSTVYPTGCFQGTSGTIRAPGGLIDDSGGMSSAWRKPIALKSESTESLDLEGALPSMVGQLASTKQQLIEARMLTMMQWQSYMLAQAALPAAQQLMKEQMSLQGLQQMARGAPKSAAASDTRDIVAHPRPTSVSDLCW